MTKERKRKSNWRQILKRKRKSELVGSRLNARRPFLQVSAFLHFCFVFLFYHKRRCSFHFTSASIQQNCSFFSLFALFSLPKFCLYFNFSTPTERIHSCFLLTENTQTDWLMFRRTEWQSKQLKSHRISCPCSFSNDLKSLNNPLYDWSLNISEANILFDLFPILLAQCW